MKMITIAHSIAVLARQELDAYVHLLRALDSDDRRRKQLPKAELAVAAITETLAGATVSSEDEPEPEYSQGGY